MIKKFTINSTDKQINLKEFSPDDTNNRSKRAQKRVRSVAKRFKILQDVFFASKKYALLIVLQGMDCSGKDGTVKKALSNVNPNGFSVGSFKVPTPEELGHDYLWRIHKETPMKGNIRVFNRSYYEDVLITRVHKTIDDDLAYQRFKEINAFEKYLVNNNTIVIKFFLHISKDFQQKKLEGRLESPEKRWKFSETDLIERKFWDEYRDCYADVLSQCSSKEAPWYVVPGNHRWFRDYFVLKTIVTRLESLNLHYPYLKGSVEDLIQEVKDSTGK